MTDLPHFALPFRFENGAAVVLEQDTTDEIMACSMAVLLCSRGFRVELPEFGIDDPTFSEGTPDVQAIEAALSEWEPRAQDTVTAHRDPTDELISYVTARIGVASAD